jgi:hypothetical protein
LEKPTIERIRRNGGEWLKNGADYIRRANRSVGLDVCLSGRERRRSVRQRIRIAGCARLCTARQIKADTYISIVNTEKTVKKSLKHA